MALDEYLTDLETKNEAFDTMNAEIAHFKDILARKVSGSGSGGSGGSGGGSNDNPGSGDNPGSNDNPGSDDNP